MNAPYAISYTNSKKVFSLIK